MSVPVPPNADETRDEPPGGAHLDETPALLPHQLPQRTPASDQRSASAVSVQSIGRYRIERQLGQGGLGAVYLAMDDELNRRVAIKVPKRMAAAQVAEYREEAQKLAKLEHPGVVPIFDIGHTEQFPIFLVTKYFEGGTLSDWVRRVQPDFLTVAKLIADVAEALHATHLKGIFHRDIKPANILVDANGKPVLADFGLALKEGHGADSGPEVLGTPAYMSPEQAAGEGHRVDGQTDIFSLGVVLYELLAGTRPFRPSEKLAPREQTSQLLELVKTFDPRPPRQVNDDVPKELERVCLKALAKRKPDRYTTARDMAEDLRHFASNPAPQDAASVRVQLPRGAETSTPAVTPGGHTPSVPSNTPQVISDREPLKIVPKGLRSFDASDASFFLDLLPGPRDRDGLPESVRFWKARLESLDPDVTFASGVLYGPSGCGKSSLVKAGLIPHLAPHVVPIYIEASGDETELRLSRAIRRACPEFGDDLSLAVLLKNLRRGVGLPGGKKAVLILDQFEQWLHAKRGLTNQELPAALRQCDGERLQCLILVRDDFWLAITRFLEELEVPILQGRNCAMADLFDPPHARKVLDAFGVAFGKVSWDSIPTPSSSSQQSPMKTGRDRVPTYDAFLDQSVAALTEEGKIISVRLALFAEMVKSKPWTPETLKAIGGVEGVGVTFLEETFGASNAPIAYRTHLLAVRGVLKLLLPEQGTDIKGHQVTRDDLLHASSYANRPRDFDTLLHILDRDLRLITPVESSPVAPRQGFESDASAANEAEAIVNTTDSPIASSPATTRDESLSRSDRATLSYQLAHDYLVPSIRNWLTKKQRETRKGRAELRLEERSAIWNAKPLNRNLPAWWEHLNIRWYVPKKSWTDKQHALMRRSRQVHGTRGVLGLLLLLAVGFGAFAYKSRQDREHVERLRLADDKTATTRINVLANSTADAVPFAIEPLDAVRELAVPKLRALMADSSAPERDRIHAAFALAKFGDTSSSDAIVTTILDAVPTAESGEAKNMVAALRLLLPPGLAPGARGFRRYESSAPKDTKEVANNRASGSAETHKPLRQAQGGDVFALIAARANAIDLSDEATQSERLTTKVRYAALSLYLGDPSVASPMCALGPDPTERTAFTLRLKDWRTITPEMREFLATTEDEALRSAVCAALGRFPKPADGEQDELVAVLTELFVTAPDGGSHSAIDWTLRQWGAPLPDLSAPELASGVQAFVRYPNPEKANAGAAGVAQKRVNPSGKQRGGEDVARRWYVNSVGMTFVEIPAGKYRIGDLEAEQRAREQQQATANLQPISAKAQYEPQLKQLEQQLQDKPDDVGLLFGRAVARFYLRKDSEAIEDFDVLATRLPQESLPTAYQFRAIAHARLKHADEARADLAKFEELSPAESSTKAYLQAVVPELLGDGKAALVELERKLAEHSSNPDWLYDGACVYGVLAAHSTEDGVTLKHTARALELLKTAMQNGFSNRQHIAVDPDLEPLHALPEFRTLLSGTALAAGQNADPATPNVELTRPVHLSNRELTVGQFQEFLNDPQAQKPDKFPGHDQRYSPTPDCPMQQISWFDSVLYCNWLSRKEGWTPCYRATGKKLKINPYGDQEIEVEDWQCDFEADGYRLPTDAEWEVACRAGTLTTWNCGRQEEELKSYCVYEANANSRTEPSGTKLPNGWGLFDVHGNVWEWCHDWYGDKVAAGPDPRGPATGSSRVLRGGRWVNVLRGGWWVHSADNARSANRLRYSPVNRSFINGVRLAQVPERRKGERSLERRPGGGQAERPPEEPERKAERAK